MSSAMVAKAATTSAKRASTLTKYPLRECRFRRKAPFPRVSVLSRTDASRSDRAANASGRGDENHTARLRPAAHPGAVESLGEGTNSGVTNVPPLGGGPPCPLLLVMEETKTRQSLSM